MFRTLGKLISVGIAVFGAYIAIKRVLSAAPDIRAAIEPQIQRAKETLETLRQEET